MKNFQPGLVAGALVVALIVAAAGVLADLPLATLGAVLIFVALRIFRVGDLRAIYRFDRVEFTVALATLGTVVVIGVGPGVLLAVLLSILYRTWRSARPRDALLGRLPGTTVWWPLGERPDAVPCRASWPTGSTRPSIRQRDPFSRPGA